MTLRKVTIDIRVKYIPQIEQNQKRDSNPKTKKNVPLPRKGNKNLSQKNKKLIEKISAKGFIFFEG